MSEHIEEREGFRRLHPLTPVLRGWKVFAAAVAIAAQQTYGEVRLSWLLLGIAASIPLGVAYGYLSWRNTHFRVGAEDLRLETGVLHKRSRRVRLDRLQAVDVVRPLVARMLGLAELRLEVAGGSSSEAPLAYLSEGAAHQLRAELLARASGLDHDQDDTPVAPERVLLTVPLRHLVEAQLRSLGVIASLLLAVALVVTAVVSGSWGALGLAVPFFLVAVPAAFNGIAGQYGFTVAESPDGLRLRRGLLETRAQTVPPGRVQAVRIVEPLLWRAHQWCRVEVDVAGYVGENQSAASVLCPVAPREVALQVLARVLPGVDVDRVPLTGVPASARWLDPFAWRFLGAGADARVLVTRRGRLTRVTDVVLHEKVQSVRLTQGPVQRRLQLATVHLDTTPGPVTAYAAHRGAVEARALVDDAVLRARTARAAAAPDRWMTTPQAPTSTYGIAVTPTSPELLDLGDPAFLDDPYPRLARLRETAPYVWHEQTGQWLAVTYQAANGLLRDRRFGRLWQDREPVEELEPFNALHRHQMMESEPPEHTRLRALVAKAFARGHVERLRPQVQARADALLDAALASGGGGGGGTAFDLVADYAEPLPVAVIADLLGVPESDRHLLRPWSAGIVAMYEYDRDESAAAAAATAAEEFAAYVREMADLRRREPRDDLVSHLVAAEEDGVRLTTDELVASAILLLNAGHEASVNAFGNGMVTLLSHPEQLARLRTAGPDVVASAVEEMLRFDSPLQLFERTAKEEVVLGDVTVPAGGRVAALLGAANRDPAAFPDPDTFDITRSPNNHIAFGAGLHHCLGAPLARMELQITLPTLLRRCPDLRPAGALVRRPGFVLRGYSSVPVTA